MKHKKKKTVALILALILLLLAGVGGVLAYFTTEGRATNVITTGTVELTLTEMQLVSVEGEDGKAELKEQAYPTDETITGIMPGMEISKIPYIENTGTEPFYARARAVITVTAADGETLPNSVVRLNVDGEKWTAGEEGWYYYNEPLQPGDKPAFFTEVSFAETMGNEYQNCTVTIEVEAQGVQTKNNPIPDGGVTEIPGWPVKPEPSPEPSVEPSVDPSAEPTTTGTASESEGGEV